MIRIHKPVCEEELLKSGDRYSCSTTIDGYTGARHHEHCKHYPQTSHQPTHDNHPSTTLPLKLGARDFANQAFRFFACIIKNWEWPGDEATRVCNGIVVV